MSVFNHISLTSVGVRHLPVLVDRAHVLNYFAMVGPSILDSIGSANACATRVTRRTKPVVLGRSSSAGSHASVCHAIHRQPQQFFLEDNVVRNDARSQVSRDVFKHIDHFFEVTVAILRHDLERPKYLGHQKLTLLRAAEVLEWHEDCSRLPRPVYCRNTVIFERVASKQ